MPIDIRGATRTASRQKDRVTGGKNPRSYTLITDHYLLREVVGELMAGKVEWNKVEAKPATDDRGEEPEHLHTQVEKVDVHLRDGLEPDEHGRVFGRIEIKLRMVSAPALGDDISQYLYVNVFPAATRGGARIRMHTGAPRTGYGPDKNGNSVSIE
jgi:hypothetical protein